MVQYKQQQYNELRSVGDSESTFVLFHHLFNSLFCFCVFVVASETSPLVDFENTTYVLDESGNSNTGLDICLEIVGITNISSAITVDVTLTLRPQTAGASLSGEKQFTALELLDI